tara:strand:+ start:597 stop:908 length:312 start_codon:yes stop_codon:yes gene_type:complete
MYDYAKLPEGLQDSMKLYLEKGIRAGGFLTACLENDLVGAINRADKTNLARLQDIVKWIYWETPQGCWGNSEKVEAWIGRRPIGEINKSIKQGLARIACTEGC